MIKSIIFGFGLLWSCPSGVLQAIDFIGLDVTKRIVVERELTFAVGDSLSCEEVQKSIQKLESLDIFASVEPKYSSEKGEIQLVLHFEELPAMLVVPSLKKNDQSGVLVGPALVALNLFGLDLRTEAFWRSTWDLDTQEWMLSINSPWLWKWPIEFGVNLLKVDAEDEFRRYHENSLSLGGFAYVPLIGDIDFFLASEYFQIKKDTEAAFPLEEMAFFSSRFDRNYNIGVGLRLDARDRLLDTRQGAYFEVQVHRNYGSAKHDLYLADLRLWQSISSFILTSSSLLRWREGNVGGYDYYVLGGANSYRPRLPSSDQVALSEWLNTIELRYVLFERKSFRVFGYPGFWAMQGVVGVDHTVSTVQENQAWHDAKTGLFTGLHILFAGIDRVRLEYGFEDKVFAGSIQVGLFEKAATQRWRAR